MNQLGVFPKKLISLRTPTGKTCVPQHIGPHATLPAGSFLRASSGGHPDFHRIVTRESVHGRFTNHLHRTLQARNPR